MRVAQRRAHFDAHLARVSRSRSFFNRLATVSATLLGLLVTAMLTVWILSLD
jgi:hypothetical protein